MTELDALRVRLDAARQMIAAAVRLAEGAADLLIEAGTDTRATVSTEGAALNPPVRLDHDRATGETRLPTRDPRASVGAGNLRD